MQRHVDHARGRPRRAPIRLLGGVLLVGLTLAGPARAQEPPVTSFQDAACRAEAKARVFSIPDPLNLGLHEIGKRLYFGCMKRGTRPVHRSRRRHHRR